MDDDVQKMKEQMQRGRRRVVFALLGVCALIGALALWLSMQPTTWSVIEERRGDAQAQLDQIQKLHALNASLPAPTSDLAQSAPTELILIHPDNAQGNTLILAAELLNDTDTAEPYCTPSDGLRLLQSVKKALKTGKKLNDNPFSAPADVELLFNQLAAIQYVIVVRTETCEKPHTLGENMYDSGGSFKGSALLFALDGTTALAGVSVEATGTVPKSVAVVINVDDPDRSKEQEQIDIQVRAGIRRAVRNAIGVDLEVLGVTASWK